MMSTASRIRHSFIGRSVRKVIHTVYHQRNPAGKPVNYLLPGGVAIRLFPEGEVAEFLTVQRFFERTELALVAAYLKPGMTVIDVGANIGLYSILAERRMHGTGTVWAFEPSLESFHRLEKNIRLNACQRVRPFRLALGAHASTSMKLKSDAGFGDAYRYLSPDRSASDEGAGHELVPVTTLDLFNRDCQIGDTAFLKIDVEGGEFLAFQGAQEFLRGNPRLCIMFESDPEWCERAGCSQWDSFELLRRLGFGLYAWQNRSRKWLASEDALLTAGMVWAARDADTLPVI
jgi:FkbM family methyltransferase